jgi:hypothetical protein
MGQANQQLSDALKRLSAAKYGHPRGQVEQEIFKRLSVKKEAVKGSQGAVGASAGPASGSSFLDEWLAKRKQLTQNPANPAPVSAIPNSQPQQPAQFQKTITPPSPIAQSQRPPVDVVVPSAPVVQQPTSQQLGATQPASSTPVAVTPQLSAPDAKSVSEEMAAVLQAPKMPSEHLSVRGQDDKGDEVSIKLH